MKQPVIGVFDSGIGGKTIADAIQEELPSATVVYQSDEANLPYGTKSATEVSRLTEHAVAKLLGKNNDLIVIACNTATTNAIAGLRRKHALPFVGVEPMVKPAAGKTKTGTIAVLATPATLRSRSYQNLKARYARSIKVLEPDCSRWVEMIEADKVDHAAVKSVVEEVVNRGADVIVLGCTHYHYLKPQISRLVAGKAIVLEPTVAIIRRVKSLLGSSNRRSVV
ncbi:glutamate racemase [Candidatus Microgenomates bacterium]|nr:glutamate racemase [Candidatus Microgenomates bacterium]